MRSHIRKKAFNLVEIVLALGVASIGIAAIMGVLPFALNSTRDTVADTVIPNLAESVFADLDYYVKTEIKDNAKWTSFVKAKNTDLESVQWTAETNRDADCLGSVQYWQGDSYTESGLGLSKDGSGYSGLQFNKKYTQIRFGKEKDEASDFVVDVRFWITDDVKIYPTDANTNDNLRRAYIEFSWPVSALYENREKRLFVREYYNPVKISQIRGE